MQPSRTIHSDLCAAGPVELLAWLEAPGRPLTDGARGLLRRLGHEVGPRSGAVQLDDHLTWEGRRLLDEAVARLYEPGAALDVGRVGFTAASGETAWFHLTVRRAAADGVQGAVTATAVDVTDARRVELELQEKSERLELVLEGTRLGMWDWNPQTGEVTFNERWAEMLGHSLSEIEFSLESWERRVHPDDLADCFADITAHIEGRTSFYENVHRMRHRDGHWVYILDRGKVVERDEQGRPTRFTGTHTDITSQKLAELEAHEASRAKGLFLATMSHEIRTPLNGILGLLQVLEGTALSAGQRELLDHVGQSGEHLLVLINDILDLSRIEAGELALERCPVDPHALVRSVTNLYAGQAREKGLELRAQVELPPGQWFATDGHRLRQVLNNLVSNAIKFTERGAVTLRLSAREEGGEPQLVMAVSDTGIGIRDAEGVWESFRQENASISRSHGGSGLGLTISKHLAELLGGSLRLESEPGVGSTFELRVPAAPCAPDAPLGPGGAACETRDLSALRVLVAEDNRVNQKVAEGMFHRLGLSITLATDGREALERCVAEAFDLVLMDLHMPELDGVEVARLLLEALGERCPRIVALSADVSEESAASCREAGMAGFLGKPFRLAELESVLRETPLLGS